MALQAHVALPWQGSDAGCLADAHDTFADSFVLVVRNHFVAVGGDEIADSGWMFDRRPQPAATAPHRRVRVRQTIACRPESAP